MIVRFPRHARASAGSQDAKAASKSAVRPAERARSVESSGNQYSAGILSRCHHLETCVAVAPGSSTAKDSRDLPQSSMMSRNDAILAMPALLGQLVLKSKADLSLDDGLALGHNVRMAKRPKVLTDYELGFLARTAAARLTDPKRSQAKMAATLEVPQDTYKWYEIRSLLPHEHVPAFLAETEVTFEWLFTGIGKGPAWKGRLEELRVKRDEEAAKQSRPKKTNKAA